jgi:Helix-turn-helix domain
MAKPIIAAIRQRHDMKESLIHTAIELAHRSSIYGVVRVSLRYLAQKCHCCKQTIINHLNKLIELGIIKKGPVVRVRGSAFCETNRYRFCIAWERSSAQASTAQMYNGQHSRPKFPHQEKREEQRSVREDEQEKAGSIREQLANQKRMLPMLYTPGSDQWNRTCEEIARLEKLLRKESEVWPAADARVDA